MVDAIQQAVAAAAAAAPQDKAKALPTPVEGRVLLVDGDYLNYYAAGSDDTDPARARRNAIEKIEAFRAFSGASRVVVHLTHPASHKGYRYLVATVKPYQGQRSSGRKPKNWAVLREWFDDYSGPLFKTKVWKDRETDDGMAYHAATLGHELAAIATADKDMRMFPGLHLDWQDYTATSVGPTTFRVVGENGKLYGGLWFWQQMLQGDTADNIPGLEKMISKTGKAVNVGEKTADKLLSGVQNHEEAFSVVSSLYEGYYKEDAADRLVEQACLLWMRRDRGAGLAGWVGLIEQRRWVDEAVARLVSRVREQLEEVRRIEQAQGH